MYGERIEIEAEIVTLSPLHVGTAFADARPIGADDGKSEVACVQKDARNAPIIPGSSLKGTLHALAKLMEDDEKIVEELFGAPLNDEKDAATRATERSGRPGRLTVRAAEFLSPGQMKERREGEGDRLSYDGREFGWITARTAIDDGSGTADANKLFRAELVAPGATFVMKLVFAGTLDDLRGDLGDTLCGLLAIMAGTDGIALGRGRGDGWGRLRLRSDERGRVMLRRVERTSIEGASVTTSSSAPDGTSIAEFLSDRILEKGTIAIPGGPRWVIGLTTDEPFLVKVENPRRDKKVGEKGAANGLIAMRDGRGLPELPGSSFMGALRARADWYTALGRAGSDGLLPGRPIEGHEGTVSDPIERLFGPSAENIRKMRLDKRSLTGWAGLLRVVSIVYGGPRTPTSKEMSSVRIDRFSAEPFAGGLFTVDVFVEPKFKVVLELDGSRAIDPRDTAFVEDLLNWMSERKPGRGIVLGHGGNRGFGWFEVEVTERPQA